MEQQAILALGAFTLIACGASLVLIHTSNPLLKGLNWMGGALLAGGTASALTLASLYAAALLPVANLCIVLAFVLCYRADQALVCTEARPSSLSLALLAAQVLMTILQWLHLAGDRSGTVVLSLLIIVQLESTARFLSQEASPAARLPARFTAGMMRCLAGSGVVRGLLAATGLLETRIWGLRFEMVAESVFIAAAVGLGFCFFWRASAKLTEELEHMASTDPLTRVYNRRVFLKWCEKELLRSQDTGLPFSVLLVDFDHFKRINDTFGHHVGDEVLCAAVEQMQDSVRGIDVLCRWGGEEFAILLPNASAAATLLVAERVRQNIRLVGSSVARFSRPMSQEFLLTVSIGAATYEKLGDGIDPMLHRADLALYEAKNAGRDRVAFAPYQPPDPARLGDKSPWRPTVPAAHEVPAGP